MGNFPWFMYAVVTILTAGLLFVLVVRRKASGATPTTAPAPAAPAPAAATTPKKPVNWLAIIIGSAGFTVFAAIVAATVFKPTGLGDIDPFWWLSIATIVCVLSVGTYKYWPISGNTSVYIVLGVVGFLLIFGTTYVVMMKLAPQETEMILGAAKNDIQGAAQSLVKTDPYGGTSIDWQAIVDVNWEKFFGILFFGICVIGFGIYVLKGHKLATLLFVVVAAATVLPTAFYLSLTYAVPEPVKEFVTGAATTVYEANPVLGERQSIKLAKSDLERDIAVSLGIYDDLVVSLPLGDRTSGFALCIDASADWKRNYGHRPWFDRNHIVDIASDAMNVNNYITVAESMVDGMKADNVTQVSYIISLIRVGAPCLPQ